MTAKGELGAPISDKMTAEDIARNMKEISVAEFFEKNRHLLGYENSTKAMLTVVKEGVDNSLDACEEAVILPELRVTVKQLGIDRFRITMEDNGPGVVEAKMGLAFGKMLFGSKFHRLKQSRGKQGLGIRGAILYAQLTTGKPAKIRTSTGGPKVHELELLIDTAKNEPKILLHNTTLNKERWHGVSIELELEGIYVERAQSIPEYLKRTAVANPYAHIIYNGPNGVVKFERTTNTMPKQPKEIKPHPYGIELGILIRMMATTRSMNLRSFLMNDFSRVGGSSAEQILRLAKLESGRKPAGLSNEEAERLHKSMQMVKLIAPPTNCISPMTEQLIENGLKKEVEADYFVAVTRPPNVYRGNPFQVEVGLAYGGKLNPNTTTELYRFANKVPLLYHQSGCAITKAVEEVDWRRYGLQQPSGGMPVGPLVVLVHFASVWVPFTSEGKEAIAAYPEIVKDIKLAIQDAGRKLAGFVRSQRKSREGQVRRKLFERYIPVVAESLEKLTGKDKGPIEAKLEAVIKSGKINVEEHAAVAEKEMKQKETAENENEEE
ncbi:MAG: DNA topoisomerase VI subunit B [Candidatus Aenigmatarchaeota archaeon]